MPKKTGVVLTAIGAVLIFSALLLLFYTRYEDARAGEQAQELVVSIRQEMEENRQEGIRQEFSAEEQALTGESAVMMIDGYDYIGILTVPALGLELPVMADWDYQRLKMAPCRQFGGAETNDLVIAAHNYKSHFGDLYDLKPGDPVIFTGLDGHLTEYAVTRVTTLQPTEVDAVQNSDSELVLYTCTYSGNSRIAAFCERVGKTEE